jgi:hypothetical protein
MPPPPRLIRGVLHAPPATHDSRLLSRTPFQLPLLQGTMMKTGNSIGSYASAHMKTSACKTNSARASVKLANVVREPMTVLGNPKHYRTFTRDNFNSKPRGAGERGSMAPWLLALSGWHIKTS